MMLEDLLGDMDLGTADEGEVQAAQEYLLFLLEETEDEEALRDGLLDYADLMRWLAPPWASNMQSLPVSLFAEDCWIPVRDGDPRARALFERHYSAADSMERRRRRRTKRFVGPGERLVLITPRADALFIWRGEKYRLDEQWGLNCAVFRNESATLSSKLILLAEQCAIRRWPHVARFFTFIDPTSVKSSNPGYCFKMAGWRHCGETTKGLLILEKVYMPPSFYIPWRPNGENHESGNVVDG